VNRLSEKINMGVTKPNAQFTELIIPIAQKIERKKRLEVDFAVCNAYKYRCAKP
jgi:hypothetical protein